MDEYEAALREIAELDAVELRAHGYSVGDKAIGIAKRVLGIPFDVEPRASDCEAFEALLGPQVSTNTTP